MAHSDAREGNGRGNWLMKWVANTLHTTSEHGVSSITTVDAHTSAASSRLNWRPRRFKWTRPFRRKTKSGFCACAITFQTQCTVLGKLCSVAVRGVADTLHCAVSPSLPVTTLWLLNKLCCCHNKLLFHLCLWAVLRTFYGRYAYNRQRQTTLGVPGFWAASLREAQADSAITGTSPLRPGAERLFVPRWSETPSVVCRNLGTSHLHLQSL